MRSKSKIRDFQDYAFDLERSTRRIRETYRVLRYECDSLNILVSRDGHNSGLMEEYCVSATLEPSGIVNDVFVWIERIGWETDQKISDRVPPQNKIKFVRTLLRFFDELEARGCHCVGAMVFTLFTKFYTKLATKYGWNIVQESPPIKIDSGSNEGLEYVTWILTKSERTQNE